MNGPMQHINIMVCAQGSAGFIVSSVPITHSLIAISQPTGIQKWHSNPEVGKMPTTPRPSPDESWPPCDVCGEPSVHMCQDFYMDATPWKNHGRITRTPVPNSIRVRCDRHRTESREYDITSLSFWEMPNHD